MASKTIIRIGDEVIYPSNFEEEEQEALNAMIASGPYDVRLLNLIPKNQPNIWDCLDSPIGERKQ